MENAEHLNSILPKDIITDLVIMNPPFSATAGRITGERDTNVTTIHIYQALARLKPGGRLVAVTGQTMELGKKSMSEWWKKTINKYNVIANIGISGKEYAKYGTTFGIRILVIDKPLFTGKDLLKTRGSIIPDKNSYSDIISKN